MWMRFFGDAVDRVVGLNLARLASGPEILRRLLQPFQNASVFEQGCTGLSLGTAHRCHSFRRHPGRTSSPLWSGSRFSVHTGAAGSTDLDQGAKTRRAFLDRCASEKVMISTYHLPFPGVGHVVRTGRAFGWLPSDWRWEGVSPT